MSDPIVPTETWMLLRLAIPILAFAALGLANGMTRILRTPRR